MLFIKLMIIVSIKESTVLGSTVIEILHLYTYVVIGYDIILFLRIWFPMLLSTTCPVST